MNKNTMIWFGVFIIGVLCLLGGFLMRGSSDNMGDDASGYQTYELGAITEMAARNDYSSLDLNSIVPAQAVTGDLPENIKGSVDAPILIFEYADYQCSSCAAVNPYINQLVKEYDGKVAVVFRTYVLSYHANGVTAASAAEAAAIQGYWSEYSNLLFSNQNEWAYIAGTALLEKLEEYFVKVAGKNGNLEKFRADLASEAVAKKLAFDQGAGSEMKLGGTPWFYIDGEWVDNKGTSAVTFTDRLRQIIDKKLAHDE